MRKYSSFTPAKNKVFVTEIDEGTHMTKGGIIITDDLGKDRGIRPRWGKVAYLGDGIDFIQVDEWVLIEHGRWTQRMEMEIGDDKLDIWMVDPDAILIVSDDDQSEARINLAEMPKK